MIVHWANILCLLLVVIAACIAICFSDEIATFLSCVMTVNDLSAPPAQRCLGVFVAAILILATDGLIHIASRDAGPPQH